jgi:hypothetical protein
MAGSFPEPSVVELVPEVLCVPPNEQEKSEMLKIIIDKIIAIAFLKISAPPLKKI